MATNRFAGNPTPRASASAALARSASADSDELDLVFGRLQRAVGRGLPSPNGTEQAAQIDAVITGRQSDQMSKVDVVSLASNGRLVISGQVTRSAKTARLEIVGGSGAIATSSARLSVEGNGGRMVLTIDEGQSLRELARQINDRSTETQVAAKVSGNNLVLSSLSFGRSAELRVKQLSGGASSVQGVNSQQVSSFEVVSSPPGLSETVSGSVISTAQQAVLRYQGDVGGLARADAAFRLYGDAGTTTVNITRGESLADVAQRINDQSGSTAVGARVEGDDLLLHSQVTGSDASVRVELIAAEQDVTTSGINPAQVAQLAVTAIDLNSQQVLSGSVTRAATSAELTLAGGPGGTVIDGATFELRGLAGAATLSIVAGESLTDVAARVNARTGDTGVSAAVSGNDLVFRSVAVGSAATAAVELQAVDHHVTVSGANSQQITGFQVTNFTDGASRTLAGSITQAAGVAELTFSGTFLGTVGANATFTLTGNSGSASFTVTALQSVQSLANAINAATGDTGVQAIRQGNNVILRSTGVGSAAVVDIDVTSGTFNTSGGDGNGLDYGTNAQAVINGQAISAVANQFTFSDSLGTYAFAAVQGFTGSLDAITVESRAGAFDVTGGNGDSTAAGLDVSAVVNGKTLTGVGNRLTIAAESGQFELDFTAGFNGSFDPITIAATARFAVEGGDSQGRDFGADAIAMINGQQLVGVQNRFQVHGQAGLFAIEFADDFTGNFDPITVTSGESLLRVRGRLGATVRGRDALAEINGEQRIGDGSRFAIRGTGVEAVIEFAPEFVGRFEPVTIAGQPARNIAAAANQSSDVETAAPGGEAPGFASDASLDFSLTRLTSQFLQSLSQTEPGLLMDAASAGRHDSLERRRSLASLLR